MAIYMKYDGILGSVTAKNYYQWIELESCQFGLNVAPNGASAQREAKAQSLKEIILTRSQDADSPNLFRESMRGEGKKVEIHFVKIADGSLTPYLKAELQNTVISSYSVTGIGGNRGLSKPMESFSLNFTAIAYK